ncbi:hypothetical protein BJ912DRAFT_947771 [Pholiota molesta]|nr:hypothetical protein BJ912DRAFT_947771 [Pholiota molesta]
MMDITRLAVCVSAVMNIYEHLSYFTEEVFYIWPTIYDFNSLKACFFIARYCIYVLHYINFMMGDIPEYLDPSVASHRELEHWIFVKNCCYHVLVWTLDYPIMKRVYLLYNRPRWAYHFLCVIGLLKFTTDVYFAVRVRRDRLADVYPTSKVPDHLFWLVSGPELMFHIILFGLAVHAQCASTQLRTPIRTRLMQFGRAVKIRLRENGSEVLVIGLLITMAKVMYDKIANFTPFIYPFFTMALSVLACRLNLSMHRAFYRKPRTRFDYLSADSSNEDDDDNNKFHRS